MWKLVIKTNVLRTTLTIVDIERSDFARDACVKLVKAIYENTSDMAYAINTATGEFITYDA